ncbi:probable transporter mch1 [Lingula anatina]|uniref:Probable transporter mch1 n=1 Tax=Lingula anatina TaxID=7574 RepID=A0A1S3IBN3_LINAN|nr:probable transporter mch1 [Lingula anatina]|eukprot:XP_013395670.1 probable transporter mch1 [Lingula anatina]
MGFAGSIYAFNAYQLAVKQTFDLQQSQVDLVASMGNIGISVGFPAGYCAERFGGRVASFVALILTVGSFTLIWSTTHMVAFYVHSYWLLYIYFLLAGFGAIFSYMAAMITNINNFSKKHRGTVIGILDASFSGGPAAVSAIYGAFFMNGHTHGDEDKQDLPGFFLFSAIGFGVASILGVLTLGNFPPETEIGGEDHMRSGFKDGGGKEDDRCGLIDGEGKGDDKSLSWQLKRPETADDEPESKLSLKAEAKSTEPETVDKTGLALLRDWDFHYLFWNFIFCAGLQLMVQANLTSYLQSFHFEKFSTIITTLSFAIGTVSKFIIGFVTDLLVNRVPRVLFLLIANIMQTGILIISIFYADQFYWLVIMTLGVGLANGTLYCLTPTILSELFGVKYFGLNWGCILMGNGFGGLGAQYLFGAIYDYYGYRTADGETECYGLHCFQLSFVLVAVLSGCASLFNAALLERSCRRRSHRHLAVTKSNSENISAEGHGQIQYTPKTT